MQQNNVVDIAQYRKKETRVRKRVNRRKKGSVYTRSGKLWVDFRYLGKRVREPSGLISNPENRVIVRKQLDLITAEIDNGVFEFVKRFPNSKKRELFALLEGSRVRKDPREIVFGEYVKQWLKLMTPGMNAGKVRDYHSRLNNYLLPYFKDIPFSEFNPFLVKKFLAELSSRTSRLGKPLSVKTIRNILIPLRVIWLDAVDEYGWFELRDPLARLNLPRPIKFRVRPFNFAEWDTLMEHIPEWYRPYFQFAVHTGLRPSEQVALKWIAIDSEFIHIELSRVRNLEKAELKTEASRRMLHLRPTLMKILAQQKELTKDFKSDYVFLNMDGQVVNQTNLSRVWKLAMEKSGLTPRRMYETRHTFASWAMSLGETPGWIARTLGHVDTSMVYRTYSRYIPNLTKQDGLALENRFSEVKTKKSEQNRHNSGHNREYSAHYLS